jgi:hypothetical protein
MDVPLPPSLGTEALPPFRVLRPARQTMPLVFASPHSGTHYSAEFLAEARLDPLALRRSEDSFVDELFAAAPALGAPLLTATCAGVGPEYRPSARTSLGSRTHSGVKKLHEILRLMY